MLTLGVATSGGTDGGVAITETWGAAKLVVQVQVEVARLALVALLTLHILLAHTHPAGRITVRLVVPAARNLTPAWLATLPSTQTKCYCSI